VLSRVRMFTINRSSSSGKRIENGLKKKVA
jgi:hypothetical protein